jgi:putative membrane protein
MGAHDILAKKEKSKAAGRNGENICVMRTQRVIPSIVVSLFKEIPMKIASFTRAAGTAALLVGLAGSACFAATVVPSAAPDKTLPPDPTTSQPVITDSLSKARVVEQMAMPAQFSNAEILGLLIAVDDNEVALAGKAVKKKISREASSYAKMLREEHSAARTETKKLADKLTLKAASSTKSEELRAKGAQELKALTALNGAEFEKAYIDAMVTGHADVLQLLDTEVIPSALDTTVKAHVVDMRAKIAAHMEHGKRLQGARASREEE